ncbi:hypothetical protein TrVE_jg9103 [Triparma verrucosa]|uniref:Uncharacterized protein n=1 Tax=Triparma verrucosa TaxID=1606542 RepID=A0A9W7B8J2_9STRA|nr:hypothetical protein TrVE_jg9103 [Triparma verrucosa]
MKIFIALTVLAFCLLPVCGYCCYQAAKDRDPKWLVTGPQEEYLRCLKHDPKDKAYCGAPGFILVVSGLATLAAWCSQAEIIQSHEYHGPMLMTDVDSSGIRYSHKFSYEYNCRQESYKCGEKTCHRTTCDTGYYESVMGIVDVGWGGAWGCPLHADKSCTSTEDYPDCHVKVCSAQPHTGDTCSDSERSSAKVAVEQCVYDELTEGVAVDPVTFDASVHSWDEVVGLHYTKLFGDCDVCSAMFTVPTGAAARNRVAGFVCLYIGLCLFGLFLLKNGCLGMMCGWEGELPYPVWMEAPAKWER